MIRVLFTHDYWKIPDADAVSTKAAIDALVLCNFMKDDTPEFMLPPRHYYNKVPRNEEKTRIRIFNVHDTDDDFGVCEIKPELKYEHTIREEFTILADFEIPVVLPTWNVILNTDPMQRKTIREYVKQMIKLGVSYRLDQEFPETFTWFPEHECPWKDPVRPWNHFMERYYRVALKRKGKIPESKLL